MGEENEQKICITTADPERHWTNNIDMRVGMAAIDNGFSYIPIEDITSIDLVDAAHDALEQRTFKDLPTWSCSFDLAKGNSFMFANQEYIRKVIFGLPACSLKKKKLNRKSFIKALMAHGIPRNTAESFARFYAYLKGALRYPNYEDKDWAWLWR